MDKRRANKLRSKLRRPEFMGAFDDLVEFTGLPWQRVCELIAASSAGVGREFVRVSPRDSVEVDLFYRCCREYLFLNSYRSVWPLMVTNKKLIKSPVLDFGAGCGNDTLWLAEKGYDVDYYEFSMIQREFMEFRLARRECDTVDVVKPYDGGKYDPLGCVDRGYRYGAVMFRDILEHTARYAEILERVVPFLAADGVMLEHSPWHRGSESSSDRVLHVEESTPLSKVMDDLGMKSISVGVWRRK